MREENSLDSQPSEIPGSSSMIIQTAPAGKPRLAIMMEEHTALCRQFARVFGNKAFEPLDPLDLMVYIIAHHDAGWTEFRTI
jgi:hypothetical protein